MTDSLSRILYVEDDASIAEIVMVTLEDLGGFTARHCDGGQKALETVLDFAPQLILMDVMMPGLSGPETLEILNTMPVAREVPVIFMTAKAQRHEQAAYRDLGAIGVIVKPFDPITLSDQITELWEQWNAARATGDTAGP